MTESETEQLRKLIAESPKEDGTYFIGMDTATGNTLSVTPDDFVSNYGDFSKMQNIKLSPVERENLKGIYAKGPDKGGPLAALVYLSYKKYSALDEMFDREFKPVPGETTTIQIADLNPKLQELFRSSLQGAKDLYDNNGIQIVVDNYKVNEFKQLVHAKINVKNVSMEPESEPRLVTFVPINYPAELSKSIVSFGVVGEINAHNKTLVDDINNALNVPTKKPSIVTQTIKKLGYSTPQTQAQKQYKTVKNSTKTEPKINQSSFFTRKFNQYFKGKGGTRRKRQLQASLL